MTMALPNLIDLENLVLAAFRTEWRQVVKAATGSVTTIAAHADGHYSRTAGSFLDDGFDVGDECTIAGYGSAGNNGMKWCEFVDDANLQVRSPSGVSMVDEAAGAPVTITFGLPANQKLDGEILDPNANQPWLSESFQPNSMRPASIGGNGGKALARLKGLYWLTTFYPIDCGTGGILRLRGKFNARIYPGRSLVYQGHTIRIKQASPKPFLEKNQFTSGALLIEFQADALNT